MNCAARESARKTSPARKTVVGALNRGAVKSACGCEKCEQGEGVLQRAAVHEHAPEEVPSIVYDVLRSPGAPLERQTREFMESRFRHDFSAVRVHTDARAAESARAVSARAYTVGSHVAFGNDEYRPSTPSGQRLIAHELAHVMQQISLRHRNRDLRIDGEWTRGAEDEAREASGIVLDREASVSRPQATIHAGYVLREAARELKVAARTARPALHVVEEKFASKAAARAGSPLWKFFWRVVSKRYATTMALAAALAAADGPLPIGELIDLGLAAWMAWDIVQAWDSIWEEVHRLESATDLEQQDVASERATDAEKKRRQRECQKGRPYALICDEDLTLRPSDRKNKEFWSRTLQNYLTDRGFDINSLGEPELFKKPFDRDKCGGGLGEAWHVPVIGDKHQTIDLCECCDENGEIAFHIVGKHKTRM